MGFLRRLLGGTDTNDETPAPEAAPAPPGDDRSAEPVEADYERELLRGEQERLDELRQRQLRYAEYAWEPPAQGGDRRADDADASAEGDR